MRQILIALAFALGLALPAHAQVSTSQCSTVTVTRATYADIAALQKDADCFGAAVTADKAAADALDAVAAKARSSQLYRLKKIEELKAAGPPVTLDGTPAIASNFDPMPLLKPAWGTGKIPVDMGADPVGAFRFICGAGQVSYDDPIVYPGQPGKSHLHQFYGNTGTDAYSTYASQRAHGESTCGDPVNRSGYWMPAMLDGKGNVAKPDYVSIYYKRLPASDPHCNDPSRTDLKAEGICVGIPNGIRFIFGYDMLTSTPRTGGNQFYCVAGNTPGKGQATLAGLAAIGCAAGNHVELMISAPTCWDGIRLDSANHRDHVSYPAYGSWGYLRCDAAHPYVMPRFQMSVFYTVAAGDDLKLWHLSSDEMRPTLPAGSTFHADYFEAWDAGVKAMWTDNCINRHLNCSGGDLGNGLQMKGADKPSYGWLNPNRLVPVPARP
jgi:hypothetical protein